MLTTRLCHGVWR